MSDPTDPSLPAFPDRPEGSDRIQILIVADRPDPGDDQSAGDLGLAILGTGLPTDIVDKLVSVGCDRDGIYAQATFTDFEQAPVVRLSTVVDSIPSAEEPEPVEEPPVEEEPPADDPDPEIDPEVATEG